MITCDVCKKQVIDFNSTDDEFELQRALSVLGDYCKVCVKLVDAFLKGKAKIELIKQEGDSASQVNTSKD